MRVAQGDLPGALSAYEAALAIAERLAAADPGNANWQRDLAVSHNKLGDVRVAQGDLGRYSSTSADSTQRSRGRWATVLQGIGADARPGQESSGSWVSSMPPAREPARLFRPGTSEKERARAAPARARSRAGR